MNELMESTAGPHSFTQPRACHSAQCTEEVTELVNVYMYMYVCVHGVCVCRCVDVCVGIPVLFLEISF